MFSIVPAMASYITATIYGLLPAFVNLYRFFIGLDFLYELPFKVM